VPPGAFIPLAEESGLIVPIGDWVVQAACESMRRWNAAGLAVVPLSINLSSPSFMQDGLVEQLDEAVQRVGIPAHQLTLEVTESLLMQDIERTVARLHALREKGFGLSLDDFGTGFSSLSYLKRFPIDELKIDRSFVRDVVNGGSDGAIVASIIELGRQFKLGVVAEGVETREQSRFLLDHGCPIQQGFLFARPMPAEQFEALLANFSPPWSPAA
jgi:EAL domain-containing protein (putative c-di-GMP-specific phosphodiesterase class I)